MSKKKDESRPGPIRNCWELQNCGRQKGGKNTFEYGICPAASSQQLDGINRGRNGGRACFGLDGTFTQILTGNIPGFRRQSCSSCPALKCIMEQEGPNFKGRVDIMSILTISTSIKKSA